MVTIILRHDDNWTCGEPYPHDVSVEEESPDEFARWVYEVNRGGDSVVAYRCGLWRIRLRHGDDTGAGPADLPRQRNICDATDSNNYRLSAECRDLCDDGRHEPDVVFAGLSRAVCADPARNSASEGSC